ncbi:unnamed protein product [Periconia digitata]|uniref:Uncharacterized protein n=1 Tax=Periconia digitata TaxID=1303443 RepID=A0A9W4U2E9_9PLEO|nr:unnamed protein product [Periconia digitata]
MVGESECCLRRGVMVSRISSMHRPKPYDDACQDRQSALRHARAHQLNALKYFNASRFALE